MSVADPVVCESTVAMHDEPTIAHSATDLPIASPAAQQYFAAHPRRPHVYFGDYLLLQTLGLSAQDLPVVVTQEGTVLARPTRNELATQLGLARQATQALYDVVVVGAGPGPAAGPGRRTRPAGAARASGI